MNKTIGRLLAIGNVAEVFEWGARALKLYKSTTAKPAVFQESAMHAAVEAMGLPVPKVWSVQEIGGRWGVVFGRVQQASFAEQMLSNSDQVPRYLECMVCLRMRIHAHGAIQFADGCEVSPKMRHRLVRRAPRRSCRRCLPVLPINEISLCRNCADLS